MSRPVLDNAAARRLFLQKHGLSGETGGLPDIFGQLAFVQLDSINTVSRAHHMILHARMPKYRPRDLNRHMTRDRAVFEHWTHDASVIDMAHFPHWKLRFRRAAERLPERWAQWRRGDFLAEIDPVLKQIDASGPVCSADVGAEEKKGSGGWWDWHPSKTALEFLWHTGAISVAYRKNFRKYYDLTERVIPGRILAQNPDTQETIDWACNAAIDRLGFATSGEVAAFFDKISAAEARDWCAGELVAGRLIEVDILGVDGKPRRSYARPDVIEEAGKSPEAPGLVRILSPFDPALRDRKRAERLLGFHYRIEVFVPAPKRQYGYYVFPVLEGDRLIGRIDMKAEKDVLNVTAFWPESGVRMGKGRLARLEAATERTRRLAGADRTDWARDWLRATAG